MPSLVSSRLSKAGSPSRFLGGARQTPLGRGFRAHSIPALLTQRKMRWTGFPVPAPWPDAGRFELGKSSPSPYLSFSQECGSHRSGIARWQLSVHAFGVRLAMATTSSICCLGTSPKSPVRTKSGPQSGRVFTSPGCKPSAHLRLVVGWLARRSCDSPRRDSSTQEPLVHRRTWPKSNRTGKEETIPRHGVLSLLRATL